MRAFRAQQFAEHWVHVAALGDLRYGATDYSIRHDVSDVLEAFDELAGGRVEDFRDWEALEEALRVGVRVSAGVQQYAETNSRI